MALFSLKTAITIANFLTNVSDEVVSTYKILTYSEMANAYERLLNELISKSDKTAPYQQGKTSANADCVTYTFGLEEQNYQNFFRYADHLATILIAAQNEYVVYHDATDGFFGNAWRAVTQTESKTAKNIRESNKTLEKYREIIRTNKVYKE